MQLQQALAQANDAQTILGSLSSLSSLNTMSSLAALGSPKTALNSMSVSPTAQSQSQPPQSSVLQAIQALQALVFQKSASEESETNPYLATLLNMLSPAGSTPCKTNTNTNPMFQAATTSTCSPLEQLTLA